MTNEQFDASVATDIRAMVARHTPVPFRAVVRDGFGGPRIVNVEAADVVDAAHRAGEFGEVAALWVTR